LDWILALFPVLIILALMIVFRWGAAKAGAVGWFTAVLVSMIRFEAGIELLALSQVKAVLLALDVLLIVWSAFLLYRVVDEAGAIQVLGKALPKLTGDRAMQALLIGWTFASFLQGVGGFGVPLAVTAPLMIGVGFSPLLAVVIPSIGHAWSVTFGSLASSFQALIASTGLPGPLLAPESALVLGLAGFCCGFAVAHAADGWSAMRRLILPVLILATSMGVTQFVLATNGLWNIAALGAGSVGLVLGFILTRWYRGDNTDAEREAIEWKRVLLALVGYIALSAIVMLVQLVEPVKSFLSGVVLRVSFPAISTGLGYVTPAGEGRTIPLFSHASAMLLYATLVAVVVYWLTGQFEPGAAGRIFKTTFRRMIPSSLGIVSMVAMAQIMAHAGMTDVLARGLAQSLGAVFPFVSPWIGALGAFMTGSNTNSNVVFAGLQLRTAELLGLSATLILAGQTAGGAIGSVVAPTKVIVGASTAEMVGKEGHILRVLLVYTAILIAVIGCVIWVLNTWF
jgi:lactate permease